MQVFLTKHVRFIFVFSILFGLLCTYLVMRSKYEKMKNEFPPHLLKYMTYNKIKKGAISLDIAKLKLQLEESNMKPNIINNEKYNNSVENSPIFFVQVHKDIKRLQYLIMSLSQVTNIQYNLLIFSHSFYSETMNHLVQKIDFCKVIQIFYPHSLQLNPNKFPGVDPEDCSPKEKNPNAKCLPRNAASTEHKQHWWWKANFLFECMQWTHLYKAPVIFLEEYHYVAPSILVIYEYAHKSFSYFPYAEMLSFGRPLTRNIDMNLLTVEPWRPPFDVGLAFNKTTWEKIRSTSAHYCMYEDSSWSYSLLNLFRMFPNGHVSMVGCMTPRVLSTKEFTNMKEDFKTYTEIFTTLDVYPKKVKAVSLFGPEGLVEKVYDSPPAGNGGWSDLRDELLCLDPLMSTTTVEPRYYDADFTKS